MLLLEQYLRDLRDTHASCENVLYMVERIDRVPRSELGIENGLADERVYVLDRCCGTGAYPVEVLKRVKAHTYDWTAANADGQ